MLKGFKQHGIYYYSMKKNMFLNADEQNLL